MAGASSSASKLPPPSTGKLLTVLSIDGGGIRGLIPAVALQFLEEELQRIEGDKSVRIAEYFDVISGTSTGGLIAAMLTAPNDDKINNRPKYTAERITNFYRDEGQQIFPPNTPDPPIWKIGPKHDGEYLHSRLKQELGSIRLAHAFTKVVIPTFDIMRISPTIFSSYKVEQAQYKYLNALLSDICIATSAAPTILPAYHFEVETDNTLTEFDMIDGGLSAGNPTLVALSEIGQERDKNPELYPMMASSDDYSNVLVVSLGCGVQAASHRPGFSATTVNGWTLTQWARLLNGRRPLTEFSYDGAMDTMDYYIFSVFKAHNAQNNYLRVQADNLTPQMAIMDNTDSRNLENLVICANQMLDAQVKRVNPVTFELEPIGDEKNTYRKALTRVAETLIAEKKARIGVFASKN
ncbi:hypothetical protein PIB30_033829 [Stylosanthes scabra]|uniref:Patatin n=1 Tax=Stylosanthes scabra TaxID=79078 RepID=A0ABU6ZBY5_9FABA|nr:hypothetical protein [Stylosanthes scabra]